MKSEPKLPNKTFTAAWIIFHIGILAAFFITLHFYGKVNFDGDVNSMFPENSQNKAAKIADANLINANVKNDYILVEHEDFSKAKEVASIAVEELRKYPEQFEKVIFEIDDSATEEVKDFVHHWRFNILDEERIEEISTNEKAEIFAYNSLSEIYSGFSMTGMDRVDEDPFMLDSKNLKNFMQSMADSGTSMRPKDGVMATEKNGKWYVLIQAVITDAGAAMDESTNAVPVIYKTCFPLEKDGIRFAFNGMNFHSYKSSSSAMKETTIIGVISIIVVVILLLSIFRSPIPLIGSLFSIALSMGIAFCMTHAIFGKMHIMTVLFGTSLIGSSIDYSIHYFVSWKHNKELSSAEKIRRHLFNGLILSLISTEICYAFLCGAPFTMLKQMSVFSLTGILSSFLTATGLFTLLKLPAKENRTIPLLEKINFTIPKRKLLSKVIPIALFVFCGITLGINHDKVKIQNDLNSLYTLDGRLKDDSLLTIEVLNFDQTCWFIVSGNTIEETLQLEEKVAKRVSEKISEPFICTSKFIPSIERQKNSVNACKNLIPLAENQFEAIGFEEEIEEMTSDFKNSILESENKFLTPESELPETLKPILDTLWIGKVADDESQKFYSLIVPSRIVDESIYREIESEFDKENVYFENRIRDSSLGLDNLTRIIMTMFLIAFVIIFIVLKFFYSWKDTLKIASIPVLSVLVISTNFILAGESLEFFGITGMILVFGLGLDYIIYKMENKESKTESFSIALSFVTTAISFGALMLSTFVPIHALGFSIFYGLVTAFICTII